jgi:hypothetical protein
MIVRSTLGAPVPETALVFVLIHFLRTAGSTPLFHKLTKTRSGVILFSMDKYISPPMYAMGSSVLSLLCSNIFVFLQSKCLRRTQTVYIILPTPLAIRGRMIILRSMVIFNPFHRVIFSSTRPSISMMALMVLPSRYLRPTTSFLIWRRSLIPTKTMRRAK